MLNTGLNDAVTYRRVESRARIKQYLGIEDLSQASYQVPMAGAKSLGYGSHGFSGYSNVPAWLLEHLPITSGRIMTSRFETV